MILGDVLSYVSALSLWQMLNLVNHSRWILFNISHSISRSLTTLFFTSSTKCITYIGVKTWKLLHDNFYFITVLIVAMTYAIKIKVLLSLDRE